MIWPRTLPARRDLTAAALWLILAAALALLPLAALAPMMLLGALLLWPPLTLVLVAWAVPFGGEAAVQIGAARLSPALPLLALGAGLVLLRALRRGQLPGWGGARPLLLPLGCLLLALFLAGWRAPVAELVMQEWIRWASLGLAVWLAARLARTTGGGIGAGTGGAASSARSDAARDIVWVLGLMLTAGALEAAWGIRGSLLREGPEAFAALGGRFHRASGHFGQPNPFGGYMNQLWPLALAPLLAGFLGLGAARGATRARGAVRVHGRNPGHTRRSRALAAWGAVVGGVCLAGLLLSWSRGAWLGAGAAAAAMASVAAVALISGPARRRGLLILWLGLGLGLTLLLAGGLERLPPALVDRLASSTQGGGWLIDVRDAEVTDANFAKIERLAHWQAALAMWADRPWLGQGPGHFELAYSRFRVPRWTQALGHAHNLYLNLLAESGLWGLAGYLICYGVACALALRACLRPRNPLEAALGLGLVGVLAALGVHSLLDHLYVHDLAIQLGLSMGLLLAARDSGGRGGGFDVGYGGAADGGSGGDLTLSRNA